MGSLTTSAIQKNLVHILFNNNGQESVGGQKTSAENVRFHKLAKSLGYKMQLDIVKIKFNSLRQSSESILSKDSFFY